MSVRRGLRSPNLGTNMQGEATKGLNELSRIFEGYGLLFEEKQYLPDRRAYYVALGRGDKEMRYILSEEFLSDLLNMAEYHEEVYAYAKSLQRRIENPSPSHFYCKSGAPLDIAEQST